MLLLLDYEGKKLPNSAQGSAIRVESWCLLRHNEASKKKAHYVYGAKGIIKFIATFRNPSNQLSL